MSQVNPFYEEAQAEVNRLEQERAALIVKLRGPYLKSDESERIGLRIQEIERVLPDIWVQASERQRRAEGKALGQLIASQIEAKESAKAAADEADRQARIKQNALTAYLAQGGTVESFEIAWPSIKLDLARDAALAAARRSMATEQAGGDMRQAVQKFLRERYGRLPQDGEFSKPMFQGVAAGQGSRKFGDAFDSLASAAPPDDIPADSVVAESA